MARFSSDDTLRSQVVQRSAANIPQATQAALFTVVGRVIIEQIVGEVTTIIEAQETIIKLVANPTVGADVDLCGTLDIDGDAVGSIYAVTGDFSDSLLVATSGALELGDDVGGPFFVAAGAIDLNTDNDSSTGQIKWTIRYRALDPGSTVEVA